MNGFLVMALCDECEIPLALYARRIDAHAFAVTRTVEGIVEAAAKQAWALEPAQVWAVSVVEFRASLPVESVEVVDFGRSNLNS